jgi:hypothetical protein
MLAENIGRVLRSRNMMEADDACCDGLSNPMERES